MGSPSSNWKLTADCFFAFLQEWSAILLGPRCVWKSKLLVGIRQVKAGWQRGPNPFGRWALQRWVNSCLLCWGGSWAPSSALCRKPAGVGGVSSQLFWTSDSRSSRKEQSKEEMWVRLLGERAKGLLRKQWGAASIAPVEMRMSH